MHWICGLQIGFVFLGLNQCVNTMHIRMRVELPVSRCVSSPLIVYSVTSQVSQQSGDSGFEDKEYQGVVTELSSPRTVKQVEDGFNTPRGLGTAMEVYSTPPGLIHDCSNLNFCPFYSFVMCSVSQNLMISPFAVYFSKFRMKQTPEIYRTQLVLVPCFTNMDQTHTAHRWLTLDALRVDVFLIRPRKSPTGIVLVVAVVFVAVVFVPASNLLCTACDSSSLRSVVLLFPRFFFRPGGGGTTLPVGQQWAWPEVRATQWTGSAGLAAEGGIAGARGVPGGRRVSVLCVKLLDQNIQSCFLGTHY